MRRPPMEQARNPSDEPASAAEERTTAAAAATVPAMPQDDRLSKKRKRQPPARLLETEWSTERGLGTGHRPCHMHERQQSQPPSGGAPAEATPPSGRRLTCSQCQVHTSMLARQHACYWQGVLRGMSIVRRQRTRLTHLVVLHCAPGLPAASAKLLQGAAMDS